MSATAYDPSTSVGRVRLLISDVTTDDPDRLLFQDEDIEAFLAMNTGVKRAAAAALLAIAGNALQVDKVIKTQDLSTDAAKVAEQLRALATRLRDEADRDDDDAVDGGGFSIVDHDPWAGYFTHELAP